MQNDDGAMNLSQLILSDRLIHEENEKIIADLKKNLEQKDSQNEMLTQKLQ